MMCGKKASTKSPGFIIQSGSIGSALDTGFVMESATSHYQNLLLIIETLGLMRRFHVSVTTVDALQESF